MTYDSVAKASVFTLVLAGVTTALWFFAVPLTEGWLRDWLVQPPIEIPRWKVLVMSFVSSWPKVWPMFLVLLWVLSFLPIELVRRIKARRR